MQPTTEPGVPIEIKTEEQEIVSDVAQVEDALQHPKHPTKAELKRIQQYQERLRRFMNRGLNEEQARQAIAKEDWDNLSPDKKIAQLQHFMVQVFRGLQGDIDNLRHNDGELADSMDINFRAFARMAEKLGVSIEEQQAFVAQAVNEIQVEKDRLAAEQKAQEKKAQDSSDVSTFKEEARLEDASGTPETPEGATEFGG